MKLHLTTLALVLASHAPAQTLPTSWHRVLDWTIQPDTDHGTTTGNPAPDSEGNLVQHYEFVSSGGGLGSGSPWYLEPASPLTWDKAWYGSEGAWSVSDDFGCVVRPRSFTHTGQFFDTMPVLRWENVTAETFFVDVVGGITVGWSGDFQLAAPIDVDVVLAKRRAGNGAVTVLYSTTVPKPTNDDSVEWVLLPIDVPDVFVEPGDELILSHRAWTGFINGKWVSIADRNLAFLQEEVGTSYCSPNEDHVYGYPGELHLAGSPVIADDALTLKALLLPYNEFGMFLCSQSAGFVQNPGGSDGNLCLGGGIGRFTSDIFNTSNLGNGTLDLDLSALPTPQGPAAAQPGETWHFQCWFRDGSSSNFTDAVRVTFQ